MATRPKKPAPGKDAAGTRRVAKFEGSADDPEEAAKVAEFVLQPSTNAAAVLVEYGAPFGKLDLAALMDAVDDATKAVNAGDMSRVESMLFAQAEALQMMFTNFSRRALKQEYQKNLEAFFRMALKAQSQCRTTLETLAAIKNPPVVIARQANINNGGQQQVNNGGAPPNPEQYAQARAGAHVRNTKPDQTELLEAAGDGQRLDTGATSASGRLDPHMAAVGAGHRSAHT